MMAKAAPPAARRVLLAVDPGLRGCGCALFEGGQLVQSAYVQGWAEGGERAEAAYMMGRNVFRWTFAAGAGYVVEDLALEWPRVYAGRIRAGFSPGDPNDLLGLAAVDGAIAALLDLPFTRTHCYAPSDWKGQLKKEVCHARIARRLSAPELAVMAALTGPKSKHHNAWDAVGIGLHHLGRFERERAVLA